MSVNTTLFAALAASMLASGSNYVDERMKKGGPTHYNTDPKKRRKRKDQRASRRKNRK